MLDDKTIRRRKLTLAIGILLFLLFVLFLKLQDIRLTKHGILLNAKTLEWVGGTSLSMDLKYKFYYKGKLIVGNNATGRYRGSKEFEKRSFPVMYDPKLGASKLLVTPSDFKKFGLRFPDSLKWVLSYLKE